MTSFIAIAFFAASMYCFYLSFVDNSIHNASPKSDLSKQTSSMDYSSNFSNKLDETLPLHSNRFEYGEAGRSPQRF